MPAKLHEVLAVEGTLNKAAENLLKESVVTLGKENLFAGQQTELTMFDDAMKHLNTTDNVPLTTTVRENLAYLVDPLSAYWDAVLQKDLTNQQASADIIIDGQTLAANVPATTLLGLETKIGELRKVYGKIHTTKPGVDWELDENAGKNIHKAKLPVRFKTEKDVDFRVVVDADAHHPAQVRELARTLNVGKYETTAWTGLMTPVEKAAVLTRIDKLLLAVKKARQRANSTTLVDGHIGKDLLTYINGE